MIEFAFPHVTNEELFSTQQLQVVNGAQLKRYISYPVLVYFELVFEVNTLVAPIRPLVRDYE